jgi:nucleoid-associated protein YgaU
VAAATVPIRVPAASMAVQPLVGNTPEVESYDEETYTCRPNESFKTISQTFFQTDRYERALFLFNRNHPLATNNLKTDSPVLQAGQPVYIPPTRILEKYYSAAISDSTATAAIPPLTAAVSETSSTAVRVDAAKTYHVAANGEMIRDVARRTLGNADLWPQIYALNPGIDPKDPVPPGTELRLPPGARADSFASP